MEWIIYTRPIHPGVRGVPAISDARIMPLRTTSSHRVDQGQVYTKRPNWLSSEEHCRLDVIFFTRSHLSGLTAMDIILHTVSFAKGLFTPSVPPSLVIYLPHAWLPFLLWLSVPHISKPPKRICFLLSVRFHTSTHSLTSFTTAVTTRICFSCSPSAFHALSCSARYLLLISAHAVPMFAPYLHHHIPATPYHPV